MDPNSNSEADAGSGSDHESMDCVPELPLIASPRGSICGGVGLMGVSVGGLSGSLLSPGVNPSLAAAVAAASAGIGGGGGGHGAASVTTVTPPSANSTNHLQPQHQQLQPQQRQLSPNSLVKERQARVAKYSVNGKQVSFRRTRSLNAPSPIQQFGPCGRIMKNSAMVMTIQDPASQRLTWYKPPLTVLVIKKVRDASVLPPFLQLVTWLIQEKRMVVCVESSVMEDPFLAKNPHFALLRDKLMTFREGVDDLTDKIDFIICLGGDGTLLYASSLFQQSVPPVMAFHLGSLGFLTPFEFENFQDQVHYVLEGHAALTLRSRLRCIIMRKQPEEGPNGNNNTPAKGKDDAPGKNSNSNYNYYYPKPAGVEVGGGNHGHHHHHKTHHHHGGGGGSSNHVNNHVGAGHHHAPKPTPPPPPSNLLVLNEVVIDRGPSPYLCNIDLFLDGKQITSVQGDGLIVSTPTGSTAYAVAAGASMIHPSVPAVMVTPICPHSLSFRPIVVPAGVELKIMLNKDARNTAWVSFDGRHQQELRHGDSLRVTTSIYPVPSICSQDQIADWFESLAECLHWNMRKKQRQFDDAELAYYQPDDDEEASASSSSSSSSSCAADDDAFVVDQPAATVPDDGPVAELTIAVGKASLGVDHVVVEHPDERDHEHDEMLSKPPPEPAAQKW